MRINQRLSICLILVLVLSEVGELSKPVKASEQMEAYLLKRIEENPDHSDNWRLLGRFHHRRNRLDDATIAFEKSLKINPGNAAAHFDYGQLLESQGDIEQAREHYQRVYQIAPESEYADKLRKQGDLPNAETSESTPFSTALYELTGSEELLQVGYQVQTFDSSEDLERSLRQQDPQKSFIEDDLRIFLETGVLWNSNVTLTPISRQLTSADASSFQGVLNPEIEWLAWNDGQKRAGPLLRGYFSVNQDDFRSLDLASFQPGLFFERDLLWGEINSVARLDYVYSVDFLGQDRFGDRHATTASLTSILPNLDAIYTYARISYSEFDAPVTDPEINSLDGPAYSVGLSRFFQTESSRLPTWSLGTDIEFVNTEGDDYRYFGAKVFTDATIKLTKKLEFVPSGNLGFRSYPDFTGNPDRNELTYRLAARLRYRLTDHWSFSAVLNYDRFASDNASFDTERLESGILTTLHY